MKGRKKIVYIEDEPEMVDLLRLILKDERIVFQSALEGRQGLELIRQCQPDLVLLDLMLPELDGWQIFEAMQKDPALEQIPIVLLTVRAEGRTPGLWPRLDRVAGYVTKPFSLQKIRQVVGRALDIEI